MRGMVNLLVLLLLTYHFRAVISSLQDKNLVLTEVIRDMWTSGYFIDYKNYSALIAGITLSQFSIIGFAIEYLASKGLPESIVSCEPKTQ